MRERKNTLEMPIFERIKYDLIFLNQLYKNNHLFSQNQMKSTHYQDISPMAQLRLNFTFRVSQRADNQTLSYQYLKLASFRASSQFSVIWLLLSFHFCTNDQIKFTKERLNFIKPFRIFSFIISKVLNVCRRLAWNRTKSGAANLLGNLEFPRATIHHKPIQQVMESPALSYKKILVDLLWQYYPDVLPPLCSDAWHYLHTDYRLEKSNAL